MGLIWLGKVWEMLREYLYYLEKGWEVWNLEEQHTFLERLIKVKKGNVGGEIGNVG